MHNRLRVNQHLYIISLNSEKPFCLNHLKALVYHCGGIDGDFRSHIPGRMAKGVGLCHLRQAIYVESAERAATGCQQYLLYFIAAFAYQALENGRMFAVYGKNRCTVLLCQLTYQGSSHHECLLVCQADGLAGLYGVNSRRKACKANHGCKHHVDGSGLYNLVDGLCSRIHLYVGFRGKHLT